MWWPSENIYLIGDLPVNSVTSPTSYYSQMRFHTVSMDQLRIFALKSTKNTDALLLDDTKYNDISKVEFSEFSTETFETVGKNPNQQLASILTVLRLEESERENQDFWREGGKVHLRKYRKKSSQTSESKPTPFKHGAGVAGVSSFNYRGVVSTC